MEKNEKERALFRRQYLVAPEKVDILFEHVAYLLGEAYTLYAHSDLLVQSYIDKGCEIILLGDMFDYEFPDRSNLDLIKDLIRLPFAQLTEALAKFSGRYVLIHIDGSNIRLLHDAMAARKVFYCRKDEKNWLCSQPHLLAKTLELKETSDVSKLAYYQSDDFVRLNNANIGGTTIYDDIFQLYPNHYLNLEDLSVKRYWPNKRISFRSPKLIARQIEFMIVGYLKSISNRYEIMMPVTGGYDSRLLLAATKGIPKNRIYHYINKEFRMNDDHPDIRIPREILRTINRDFHIQNIEPVDDEEFRNIYFQNNPYASATFLPLIYNYYKKFQNKVNLPGTIISIAWGKNRLSKRNVTADLFAKYYGVANYKYSVKCYQDWMSGCKTLCKANNIDIVTLFHWEERLFNWGGQIQLDKDIAMEDLNVFNSRLLMEYFLSVRTKYSSKPRSYLHRRIIKSLWPELLNHPLNPSRWNPIYRILLAVGIYWPVRKLFNRI